MAANRRRIFIIIISVSLGTLLSWMLIVARYGKTPPGNMSSLIVNFAFSLALVFGLGIFLSKQNKNKKEKEN
jgi:hypothetical protein